jgi:hypothetical protein
MIGLWVESQAAAPVPAHLKTGLRFAKISISSLGVHIASGQYPRLQAKSQFVQDIRFAEARHITLIGLDRGMRERSCLCIGAQVDRTVTVVTGG